jgi:pimeloyl-ACP methyl ester carboxylesterase
MQIDWELCESGPADADRAVLLLPGGLLRARSYREVMTQPALKQVRLVAATLPGHGGTSPPDDFGIEYAAGLAARLAAEKRCDVVLGFSMGASVALEMAASGAFSGPVVLLGISLSLRDEPAFLRVLDRLGAVLGSLPFAAMRQMMARMSKDVHVSEACRAELLEDVRRNDPAVMRKLIRSYVEYLGLHGQPAARLCDSGVPAWIVHAEKGDGGLTDGERQTLQASPTTKVVTIPGASFLLPYEKPERIAELLVEALDDRCPA